MSTWRTCTLRFFTRFPAPFFWKTENSPKTEWFCENSIYLILKKKPLNPPSSAQRRKNMVQNHEKPNRSLFRAFGRGFCSPPARCRIARAPDHVGGNRLARYSALKFRRWRCAAKKCKQARARLADRQPRLRAAQVVVLRIGRRGRGRGHSEQVGKINAGRAPARAADGGPPPPILTPKRAYLKSERFYFPTLGHRPVSENKLFAFCVS